MSNPQSNTPRPLSALLPLLTEWGSVKEPVSMAELMMLAEETGGFVSGEVPGRGYTCVNGEPTSEEEAASVDLD